MRMWWTRQWNGCRNGRNVLIYKLERGVLKIEHLLTSGNNNVIIYLCPNGGIGRRTRLKIVRETMWVRVPLWAPQAIFVELFESLDIT